MGRTEEGNSVVSSFGLHSGLRQGGVAFGVWKMFYGTAEAVPFRKVEWGTRLKQDAAR